MRIPSCFILILLLGSCTFKPEDDFFVKVQPGDPTVTTFQFFNDQVLNFRKMVLINITPKNSSEIVSYQLFLGDRLIQEGEIPQYLSIDSREFEDGVYDLTLLLIKRRNGQSLGSTLGLELYEEEVKRTVTIFNGPIPKPEIKAITVVDGILNIEWEKYPAYGFNQYILSTNYGSQTLNEINTTKVTIPEFVGGEIFIDLSVEAYQNESAVIDTSYTFSLHEIIEKTSTGIKFTWNNSTFKNWNGVVLAVLKDDGSYNYYFIDKSENEFTAPKTWVFPYYTEARIETRNTINSSLLTVSSQYFTSRLMGNPKSYSNVRNVIVNSSADTAFTIFSQGTTLSSDVLIRYGKRDFADRELLRKSGIISASPNYTHLFEFNNNIVSKIDPVTFEKTEEFVTSTITGTYDQFLQLHVSNDSKIALYVKKGAENWYYVFDWNTKNLIVSGPARADKPLTKFGNLAQGGRLFFLVTEPRILDLGVTPNNLRNMSGVPLQVSVVDRMRNVFFNNNELTLLGLNMNTSFDFLATIPYSKNVVAIFTNQEDVIGVAYAESGFIKIDFFAAETLSYLQTLSTSLSNSPGYQYHLFKNKLTITGVSGQFNPNTLELTF